jgi:hypothetical protein
MTRLGHREAAVQPLLAGALSHTTRATTGIRGRSGVVAASRNRGPLIGAALHNSAALRWYGERRDP